jgi:hypothetical protein
LLRHAIIRFAAAALLVQGAQLAHASDLNVGVSVAGQISPGVYGRVDIGNTPPPVVYAQPVVVVQQPRPVAVAPIYMNVPPGHAKHWEKHCHKYNACGQPVYFVKTAEYEVEEEHGHGHGKGKGHGHGHGRDD